MIISYRIFLHLTNQNSIVFLKLFTFWTFQIAGVKTQTEILRLQTELKVKEEEKHKAEAELLWIKAELAHFDSDFFNEIEDLKYNYSESMKKNVMYEEQLRALSKQFGVQVDIPNSDSD